MKDAVEHEALLEGPLVEVVDRERLLAFSESYFIQEVEAGGKRSYGHVAVNIRRRMSRYGVVRPLVRGLSAKIRRPEPTRLNSTHLIRRLALLSLFIQELERGKFTL